MRTLLMLLASVGLVAAAVPGAPLVRFPPELPDAGGVAVAVAYGAAPGELVLRFEPSTDRPLAMAIPEGGVSGGISGPVVVAAGQPVAATAVRYTPATAPDPRAGTAETIEAVVELQVTGPLAADPQPVQVVVGYTVPGEGLVVQRQLGLPVPAAWLPAAAQR